MPRLVASFAAALAVALAMSGSASAGTVPAGFQETTAFSGLTNPTVVRFAPDGRVFVAEKSGLIKVFDGLGDPTPTTFADLRTQVHNFWDRGLLGMALSQDWGDNPVVYVSYTHDAAIGGTAPRWGTAGVSSDGCPTPPGPTADGCVVSGRVSKLPVSGDASGPEQVLIEDWCQQYPSHSVGSLESDASGWLYVSGGEGASFNFVDYGQDGSPTNPCGDPPTGPGTSLTPPTAQGGALRSQDLRTSGDPTSLDGTLLRIDPSDGSGASINPQAASADPNLRRIIAYGLRNPFRFTFSPQGDIWIGDVGWNTWEEINRLGYSEGVVRNFGWPCYEGVNKQPGYNSADLSICENLYTTGARVPFFSYNHSANVVPGETCPTGSSSISGLRFYTGATYPGPYANALFFADYSRDCIWVMREGASGAPDPTTVATFDAGASNPVYLETGPDGAIYYVDFENGRIQRIQYSAGNQPPVAVASATPRSGNAPLTVEFDGSGSSDPDPGDSVTYAWDLDADGQYDDSTAAQPSYTYTEDGSYNASLQVTDSHQASSTAPVTINVGDTPPDPAITSPTSSTKWRVGQTIPFAGSANDAQDGPLPASALDWTLTLQHCPSNCHSHVIQSFDGTAGGSFSAPDHEYPSYLELTLTATDSGGLSASRTVRLDPSTISITLDTNWNGLKLLLNGVSEPSPFTRTVIQGSTNSISAPTPQTLNGRTYDYRKWSDGGARTHNISPTQSQTFKATYRRN
jgi:glucose/arabinose dehydrogenase